jgi:hypothetical protein
MLIHTGVVPCFQSTSGQMGQTASDALSAGWCACGVAHTHTPELNGKRNTLEALKRGKNYILHK